MSSSGSGGGSLPPNFLLTPHQQSLLFAALSANKQKNTASPTTKGLMSSPPSLQSSPIQKANGAGIQESPYLDNCDYDLGDSSFDFSFASTGGDQARNIGDIPDTGNSDSTEGEAHEKRSHPDDEEGDSSPGNDSKRRESTEKVAKKPGRKPLTSEPISKRKAQNRAAQRAFRERKEKHLKDLETKVEELEKASEASNHENSKLRAQVDRMTTELNQYKQRLSVMTPKPAATVTTSTGSAAFNNLSDVNFHFEFPKFGALPGPPISGQSTSSQLVSPQQRGQNGQKNSRARSPGSPGSESKFTNANLQQPSADDFTKFAGAFASSGNGSAGTRSRASVDSVPFSVAAATSSPSASSNSNAGGPSSSCGTSPEPSTQSPMGFKPLEMLNTIGEEQPTTTAANQPFEQFANVDTGCPSFDWLVQQNGGGSFDPQLFGDFREPRENVLSNPSFDDFFFNDGLDDDFFTPFNTAPTEATPRKNLIAEIDAQQDAVDNDAGKKPDMGCNQLWEKLQECPAAQHGDFDLDGLCSELTKKAKCSGSGPVVSEKEFDSILNKYTGKVVPADRSADKPGIAVKPDPSNGVAMP